jgi:hypothetical protein
MHQAAPLPVPHTSESSQSNTSTVRVPSDPPRHTHTRASAPPLVVRVYSLFTQPLMGLLTFSRRIHSSGRVAFSRPRRGGMTDEFHP